MVDNRCALLSIASGCINRGNLIIESATRQVLDLAEMAVVDVNAHQTMTAKTIAAVNACSALILPGATLLQPEEIQKLVQFSKDIPKRFPAIVDDEDRPVAADVEFAFVGGELELLQIRPFLESRRARATSYLTRMDEGLRASSGRKVRLGEAPPP